jgi:hypothetical protein
MNWEAIGAIGEFISAFAVLITLIYLAAQVRQVKKDLHISGFREINKFFDSVASSVTTTPDLAKVIAKARREEALEDWERVLLGEYYFQVMTSLEVAWQHIKAETIDVIDDDALATIDWYLDKPGMVLWWQENRQGFLEDWRNIVDERLKDEQDA